MRIADLPVTVPVWDEDPAKPSARLFFPDLSRGALYEGCRRGEVPCLRIGKRLLCPTARLLELVGVADLAATNGKEMVDAMNGRRATGGAIQSENAGDPVL